MLPAALALSTSSTFTRGSRQRCAVSKSLMISPDEPTSPTEHRTNFSWRVKTDRFHLTVVLRRIIGSHPHYRLLIERAADRSDP